MLLVMLDICVARGACYFMLLVMLDIYVVQCVHHMPLYMFMCSLCVHVFSMCSGVLISVAQYACCSMCCSISHVLLSVLMLLILNVVLCVAQWARH